MSVQCFAVGFGIRAGVSGSWMKFGGAAVNGQTLHADSKIGFNVGIYTDIKIMRFGSDEESGSGLYIRPEGIFTQTGYDISALGGATCSIRQQSVDIPVLVNVKMNSFRLYAGPSLSTMYNCRTLTDGGMDFTGLKPFVNYTAGAGFDWGMFTIDMRYNGIFKRLTHSVRLDDMTTGANIRSTLGGWAVSVGVSF